MVPNINKGLKQIGRSVIRNSPTILTGLSVAGLVTSVGLGIGATPKALQLIEEENRQRLREWDITGDSRVLDPLTKLEIVKLTWRCYIPTVAMGLITIVCTISSNSINLRRNAALATLYSLADATFKEYQEKVVETLGKNKEEKLREEILQDRLDKNPVKDGQVIITGVGETLCYDSLSGRYFRSDIETIRKIQNDFNAELLNDMFRTVNELYYELGLEPTVTGRDIGWSTDYGLLSISFSAKIAKDNQPCIVLDYKLGPRKP